MKFTDRVINWFYGTWLGGKYMELLLFIDQRNSRTDIRYLSPKEMSQIIRESSKIYTGTKIVKQKINNLVASKTKEEYEKVLSEIEELTQLAKYEEDSTEAKFAAIARQLYVKKGNKDIVTATDRAKMIDQRIQDMYELQEQRARQQMMRKIRKLRTEGKLKAAEELQKEWYSKYGRTSR